MDQNASSPRARVVLDVEQPSDNNVGDGAVRIGDFKLLIGQSNTGRPGDWSNHEPWLNVTGSEPNTWVGPYQLYNVVSDPEERHDLINDTSLNDTIAELKVPNKSQPRLSIEVVMLSLFVSLPCMLCTLCVGLLCR